MRLFDFFKATGVISFALAILLTPVSLLLLGIRVLGTYNPLALIIGLFAVPYGLFILSVLLCLLFYHLGK